MPAFGAVVFQNDEAVRKRSSIGLASLAVLVALISIGKASTWSVAGGLIFAALFGLVAYRNWAAGLYIEPERITIRNVFLTRRLKLGSVAGAEFSVGRLALAGWGYVYLRTTDGKRRRITALRRPPATGARTVGEINTALAGFSET